MPRGRPPKAVTPPVYANHIKKITYTRNPGHPTYYQPEYCDLLIDTYAQGRWIAAFCVKVGIAKSTFHEWVNTHQDFKEAYEFAKTCGEAYYDDTVAEQAASNEKAPNSTQLMAILNNKLRDEYSRNPHEAPTTQHNTFNVLNIGYEKIKSEIADLLKADPALLEYANRPDQEIIDVTPSEETPGDL